MCGKPLTFLVLLAILGIAGLCAGIAKNWQTRRRRATTSSYTDIHGGIKTALDAFHVDNGIYPKSLQDLLQQSRKVQQTGMVRILTELPVDPWGHKYIYEYPGKHNTNSYDLFSAGPDGKAGTEDDIGNWQ